MNWILKRPLLVLSLASKFAAAAVAVSISYARPHASQVADPETLFILQTIQEVVVMNAIATLLIAMLLLRERKSGPAKSQRSAGVAAVPPQG